MTEIFTAAEHPYVPSAFFSVLGTTALFAYTFQTWLDPLVAILASMLLVFPASVGVTLVLRPRLVKPGENRRPLWIAMIIAFGFSVLLPTAWAVPSVRSATLSTFGGAQECRAAVSDPARSVRLHACKHFIDLHDSIWPADDLLAERPLLAQRCLSELDNQSDAERIASGITNRWQQQLVSKSRQPAEQRCQKANVLAHMPIADDDAATKLFQCAIRSPSNRVRFCCARAARRAYGQCRQLIDDLRPGVLRDSDMEGPLLGAVFGENKTARKLGSVVHELDLTCRTFKRASLQLACASTLEGRPDRHTRLYLDWAIRQHDACIDNDAERPVVSNARICRELKQRVERGEDAPERAICLSNKHALEAAKRASKAAESEEGVDGALVDRIVSTPVHVGGGGGGWGGSSDREDAGNGPDIERDVFARQRCRRRRGLDSGRMWKAGIASILASFESSKEAMDRLKEDDRLEGLGEDSDEVEKALEEMQEGAAPRERLVDVLVQRGASKGRAKAFLDCIASGSDNCDVPRGLRSRGGPRLAYRAPCGGPRR